MGVVYKLKQEVIDFILQNKKDRPSLSCRELSSLVSQTFNLSVSKSSVNNILQQAALSSSVGRRSSSPAKKKRFRIPVEKKKQIKDAVSRMENVLKEPSPKAKPIVPPPVKEKEEEAILKKEPVRSEKPDLSFSAAPVTESEAASDVGPSKDRFLKEVEAFRIKRKRPSEDLVGGAGLIFLKAAQWAFLNEPFWGPKLRNYAQGFLSEDFNEICDFLFVCALMGGSAATEMKDFSNHALTHLSEEKKTLWAEKTEWLKTSSVPRRLYLEYIIEKRQIFQEVGLVSFLLGNGERIFSDPFFSFCGYRMEEIFLKRWIPFQTMLRNLTTTFLSPQEPIIFLNKDSATDPSALKEFILACTGSPQHNLREITVFNQEEKEVVVAKDLSVIKRELILALWPGSKVFSDITKTVKWAGRKCYYHATFDQAFYYAQTAGGAFLGEVGFSREDVSLVTLWSPEKEEPVLVLVTNQTDQSSEEIIEKFLRRWPYAEKSLILKGKGSNLLENNGLENMPVLENSLRRKKSLEKKEFGLTGLGQESAVIPEDLKIIDLFQDFGLNLIEIFFPKKEKGGKRAEETATSLLETLYNIKGRVRPLSTFLIVELFLPKESALKEFLQKMVKKVNEDFVLDPQGRRLFIKIF